MVVCDTQDMTQLNFIAVAKSVLKVTFSISQITQIVLVAS